MPQHILFVDDEERVLQALSRMLRPMRNEWNMTFASSGPEALRVLSETPTDVLVSDMRMPGMDGAELLTQVSQRHPEVARVVLSGHTEPEAAIKVAIAGHRFLTKPTETEVLSAVIGQLTVRTSRSNGTHARRLASAVRALPTLPQQVEGLRELLATTDVEPSRVVRSVVSDTGLTAKLLQLSNSAWFGGRPKNASIEAVVNALGLLTIQALADASAAQWSTVAWGPATEEYMRVFWRHAVATSGLMETVASPAHRPYAQAAALLQDVGRLACLANGPDGGSNPIDLTVDEYEGVPFREVGVELLHLWGLPSPVVAAVAERDLPHHPAESGLGVVGAVRAAHLLIQRTGSADPSDTAHDEELAGILAHPQLASQSVDWAAAAEQASDQAAQWLRS